MRIRSSRVGKCSNPAYGQGMSVAALEACFLGKLLQRLGNDGDRRSSLPLIGD